LIWRPLCSIRFSLDRIGTFQAIGGLMFGRVALFSSYDDVTAFSRTIQFRQEWGVLFILDQLAAIFAIAELA
jgi:hypothetical protein